MAIYFKKIPLGINKDTFKEKLIEKEFTILSDADWQIAASGKVGTLKCEIIVFYTIEQQNVYRVSVFFLGVNMGSLLCMYQWVYGSPIEDDGNSGYCAPYRYDLEEASIELYLNEKKPRIVYTDWKNYNCFQFEERDLIASEIQFNGNNTRDSKARVLF